MPDVLLNAIKLHQGPLRLPTGNYQLVLNLATAIARRGGVSVKILTDLDSHGPLSRMVGEDGLERTSLRGNSILAADAAVAKAVWRLRPRIYHRPTGQMPFFHLPARLVAGVADLSFMVLPHPWLKRFYKKVSYRWSFRVADRVVAISRFTGEDIMRRFPRVASKVRVVPLGANPLPAPESGLADSVGGRYFLVFAHQTHKNAESCLEAFRDVRQGGLDVKLALVGRNEYIERALKPMVMSLGLPERSCLFVGAPSAAQLAGLYRQAICLVFPSRFEGFGLPVLEAMGLDCPVVCSNVCSLPEVAGEAAVMLEPDDVRGLAEAMRGMCVDEAWRQGWVRLGRERVKQFTWERAAEQTVAVYEELLQEEDGDGGIQRGRRSL